MNSKALDELLAPIRDEATLSEKWRGLQAGKEWEANWHMARHAITRLGVIDKLREELKDKPLDIPAVLRRRDGLIDQLTAERDELRKEKNDAG